ncbi:transcriptional regulator [Longispora fulva]|uniref:DNA-binding transcriptional MerR regulator n=1 Tax=Longispora fulva TaxID=619741 RepID=A0A8J7G7A1_9ACTN|nr:DNA-binding transcriptional MerR regulator [Longispora fulva]GIG56764.1 transcriptional regulator [Longispora fulva]
MSVATIKFYLRERLLPPGTLTARNQADYDETHLARIKMIRTLTGIGMMSLSAVREVLAAIDDSCVPQRELYQVLNGALCAQLTASTGAASVVRAQAHVDEFIEGVGWRVGDDAPGRTALAQVVAALRDLGCTSEVEEVFLPYARAAEHLAVRELDAMPPGAPELVTRTVLFEVAFAVMRRMAYEHLMALRDADSPVTDE